MGGHTLIVGSTGMLWGLTQALARRNRTVTVLCRAAPISGPSESIQDAPADDHAPNELIAAIDRAIHGRGPIDTAITWIHTAAPGAMGTIADRLDAHATDIVDLVEVLGYSPDRTRPRVRHRRAVLGWIDQPTGARWLTHDEIGTGVLRALESIDPVRIIGDVMPWSRRP